MANPGFGAVPIRHLNGKNIIVNKYFVPATDGTAIFKGDFVGKVNTMDAKGEYPVVKALANTGDAPVGVVVGFEVDASNVYTGHYRAASTARYVYVVDDPDVIFAIQEDTLGAPLTAAEIGQGSNCDINIATTAGNAYTGLSGHMIDSSTATVSSAVLKIVGIVRDGGTNVAAMAAGAIVEVIILEHALRTADSIT